MKGVETLANILEGIPVRIFARPYISNIYCRCKENKSRPMGFGNDLIYISHQLLCSLWLQFTETVSPRFDCRGVQWQGDSNLWPISFLHFIYCANKLVHFSFEDGYPSKDKYVMLLPGSWVA